MRSLLAATCKQLKLELETIKQDGLKEDYVISQQQISMRVSRKVWTWRSFEITVGPMLTTCDSRMLGNETSFVKLCNVKQCTFLIV